MIVLVFTYDPASFLHDFWFCEDEWRYLIVSWFSGEAFMLPAIRGGWPEAMFTQPCFTFPEPKMERLSRSAHQRGDFLSSEDYLDELRSELAKACEAEASR